MANRHRGPVEIPVVEKLAADYSIATKPSELIAAVAFTLNSRSPAETWKCAPPTSASWSMLGLPLLPVEVVVPCKLHR
jgi:hypothetical protein